jgi:hypothetical protein
VPRNTGCPPQIKGLRSKTSSSFGAGIAIITIARTRPRGTSVARAARHRARAQWLVQPSQTKPDGSHIRLTGRILTRF